MSTRVLLLLTIALLIASASCGGGDKHLPSSNPPEYDPKKVYTAPAAPPSASATVTKPSELELLRSKLDSLETSQKSKGEGKKIPFDPSSLQLFKGVTSPCEALSRLAPGLGSTQLFAGQDGAALKKALGPDADGIARRMDEQLAEGLKQSLGPGAADCPISVRPRKSSRFIDRSLPAHLVLTHTTPSQPLLLAQNTIPDTSQDDYHVDDPQLRRENAPPDWVGYKTTDTMRRIGKEDRPTKGIREDYEMIIAPKAKQCPHLEGDEPKGMVDGTFEWSFMMFRATPGPLSVLYRRKVRATLKGEVDDDAQLKKVVKFDVTVTLQHIGTELPHYSETFGVQGEFNIDQRTGIPQEFKIITVSGFSEGEASEQRCAAPRNAHGPYGLFFRSRVCQRPTHMEPSQHLRRDPVHAGYQDKEVCSKRIDSGEDGTEDQERAGARSREVQGGERAAQGGQWSCIAEGGSVTTRGFCNVYLPGSVYTREAQRIPGEGGLPRGGCRREGGGMGTSPFFLCP